MIQGILHASPEHLLLKFHCLFDSAQLDRKETDWQINDVCTKDKDLMTYLLHVHVLYANVVSLTSHPRVDLFLPPAANDRRLRKGEAYGLGKMDPGENGQSCLWTELWLISNCYPLLNPLQRAFDKLHWRFLAPLTPSSLVRKPGLWQMPEAAWSKHVAM